MLWRSGRSWRGTQSSEVAWRVRSLHAVTRSLGPPRRTAMAAARRLVARCPYDHPSRDERASTVKANRSAVSRSPVVLS